MSKSKSLKDKQDNQKELSETTQTMVPPEFGLMADPLQAKQDASGTINSPMNTAGESLSAPVQSKMEASMGADFSDVKVHKNSGKAESIGAKAFAQGNEVHFAGGQYDESSKAGQELLGHELAHVVQQKEGRVNANGSVGGVSMNDSSSLEQEADQMGAKAAEGKSARKSEPFKVSESSAATAAAPVQRFKMDDNDIKKYPKFADFVKSQMVNAANDSRIAHYLNVFGTNEGETARDIRSDLQWGNGPTVKPRSMRQSANTFTSGKGSEEIRIRRNDIENYEKNNGDQHTFHELLLESSILNSYTQFLDDQDGKDLWGKEGKNFEKKSYGRDINSTWDARDARRARFGEGNYKVSVVAKNAAYAQRIKIWNAGAGNGQHIAKPGTSINVTGKRFPKWLMQVEHNKDGENAKKGWEKSRQIVTQECEDKWLIRSEDWIDKDNNDLMVVVEKMKD